MIQTGCQPHAFSQRPVIGHSAHRSRRLLVVTRANHGDNQPKNMFIFGLGYTGLAAANYFQQRGWNVSGTCRSEDKTETLRAHGFHDVFTFHTDGYQQLDRPALQKLMSSTHILSTVPPQPHEDIDPVLMAHARELVQLSNSTPTLQWLGYISSTSVYGDHGSDWVDEDSDLRAAHGKGLSRILVEGNWVALCYEYGLPVHVFRCGGIYGPRRSAFEALQREGPPSISQIRRGRQRYTARCHVYDICKVLDASARRPHPGGVYNVVDDEPACRQEVMAFASDLLEEKTAALLHNPSFSFSLSNNSGGSSGRGGLQSVMSMDSDMLTGTTSAGNSGGSGSSGEETHHHTISRESSSRSRSARPPRRESRAEQREHTIGAMPTPNGEKRVKNGLIKRELGVQLEFPTYREGLKAILNGDERPFDK